MASLTTRSNNANCCANFASAMLVQAGLLGVAEHVDHVRDLVTELQRDGWTQIPVEEARRGDVLAAFYRADGEPRRTDLVWPRKIPGRGPVYIGARNISIPMRHRK